MTSGFPTGKHPESLTGAGVYARRLRSDENAARTLSDHSSDLTAASVAELVVTFCTVMDSMTRTNNTTSLAELGRYAGRLWWEMTGRGVEFK